ERGTPLGPCTWAWTDGTGTNPIPGWTVTRESVARFRIDASDVHCPETWRAPDGQYSIDLDGENPGAIATTIETIPGESYELTFKLTGNCDPNQVERRVAVTVGTETREFVHRCEFDGDESWSIRRWIFDPTDHNTTIVFASLSPGGSRNGAVIDDVVVTVYQHPGGENEILEVPAEYATIQAAVDAASDDMTILVAPGVYTPPSTIDLFGKRLVLRGSTNGDGLPTTTLDGENLRRVLHCRSDERAEIVIEDFVITGGSGSNGGGLLVEENAHAMLRNCIFTENAATGYGGAVAVVSGDASFLDCRFEANSSDLGGGALGLIEGRATLEHCRIESNTGPQGGGMNIRDGSELSLADCRLVRNVGDGGGAIHGWTHSNVEALRCDFWANEAPSLSVSAHGGAMYLHRTSGSFTDCLFLENVSAGHAGAIITYLEPVSLSDCLFIANEGGFAGNTFLVNESVLTMNDSTVCDGEGDWIAYQGGGSLSGSGNTITGSCSLDDCDGDGNVDAVQILEGILTDCDRNLVPDECELTDLLAASEPRTPESVADFVEFDVSTMADARDTVTVELSASGDLATTTEFMLVYLDDANLGLAFVNDGAACDTVSTVIEIPAADWNASGLDGTRLIRISGNAIDPAACPDPFTAIDVTVPVVFADCNTNGVWDACEVTDGSVLDSDDDGVIDDCDGCPDDPAKTDPGVCGCGTPETGDSDGDGILDCVDPCPNWPYDCSEDGQTLFVAVGEPIQLAVDVVPAGGVVELGAGTHVGTGERVVTFAGKPTTLRGAVGGDPVIIDGEFTRRGLYCVDPAASGSVVENLEIRHGDLGFAGGGAHLRNTDFTFRNCRFVGNRATGSAGEGDGGGLYALEGTITLEGCDFEDNNALRSGGGLRIDHGAIVATDCDFSTNVALYGGGISGILETGDISIDGCNFTSNTSTQLSGIQGGGAIHAERHSTDSTGMLEITGSFFSQNQSIWGGAVRLLNADATFDQCIFTENGLETGSEGGAFHVRGDSTVLIQGCTATGNRTGGRGGFLLSLYGADVTIEGSVVRENVAEDSGGALALEDASLAVGSSTICGNNQPGPDQISGDFTDLGGNCISEFCDSDEDGVPDCDDVCPGEDDLLDTDGDDIPDCLDPCPAWPYDCSEDGQTIFVAVGQSIQNALYAIPEGGTVEVAAGTFAIDGEFGLQTGGDDFSIRGAVDGNGDPATILDAGGDGRILGIDFGQSDATVLENLVFANGERLSNGGAIGISQGSTPIIRNCHFVGNQTGSDGGAVFVTDASPTFIDCRFAGNFTAVDGEGGGLYIEGGLLTMTGCVFDANEAGGGGGLVLESATGSVTMSTFTGNLADRGGAVYAGSSELDLSGSRFEANVASIDGGGIHAYQSVVRIDSSIVCGNTPDQVFGGYTDLGGNCVVEECGDDLDGNGIPDVCDPDCNGDGIPDGLEADCDENGIPDECEVADGTADDCNANGIPDSCDIASGVDEDENGNDIPDACDVARGDLNLDGCIDAGDLGLLIALWGIPDPPVGDLNGDGVISAADLGLLIGNWTPCAP
ncbi:MAG: right-handed parallel beta-helix repeat-containing protein, partial [Planctomycetota bacterium]|nr:right-handed parallel beta-helix repeat-containing protein [Planctomycetota bacterium]